MRPIWRVFLATLVCCGLGAAAAEDSRDVEFLDGLRQRRLFGVAETFCRDRLAESDLSDERRAELAIELSRTLAEHATSSPLEAREPFWRQSRAVVEEFAALNPRHSRVYLLRTQAALTALAEGELLRQEAEVNGDPETFEPARTPLRKAIAQLKQLESDVTAEAVKRNRQLRAEPGQLSSTELAALQENVRFQLARALRNQALCYPADSADRLSALSQSLKLLAPLTQESAEHPLVWQSRLDELVCFRLLRDYEGAVRKTAALAKEEIPASLRSRFRAEQLRLTADRGKLDEALAAAGPPGRNSSAAGAREGDLNYARLEVYLAAWRQAQQQRDAQTSAALEKAATAQARYIEQVDGPYWRRRAETLLARAIGAATNVADLDALRRAAESYYRGNQWDAALKAYDRAAAQAKAQNNPSARFDLAYSAAALENERKQHRAAADRYRALSLESPTHAKAGAAHLLAAYNAGQLGQQQTPPDTREYTELLAEHLREWPRDATTGQAAWWLGVVRENQADWTAALAAYRVVPPDHAQFGAALAAIERCYRSWLRDLRRAKQPTAEPAREAARYFESLIFGAEARLPQQWNPATRQAVLAAARIWLEETPGGASRAEELVRAGLQHSADAPADWIASARSIQVTALAAQGRASDAAALLKQIATGATADFLPMLDWLSQAAATFTGKRRRELAELELAAIELIEPRKQELSPENRQSLERLRATALADAGRRGEALAAFESLSKQFPADGKIQEHLAMLLGAAEDADSLKAALAKWIEIEQKSRPASPRWYRAQLGVAQCQFALGRKPQARTTIKVLQASHPDFGGGELKGQFLDLLAECEK